MKVISCNAKDASLDEVGGKAMGLFTLKSLEPKFSEKFDISFYADVDVPPFFIIPDAMRLDLDHQHILDKAKKIGGLFAVRSSSKLEDNGENSFDGIFETRLNVPLDRLIEEIIYVRKSATSQKARKYAEEIGVELDGKMPVIIHRMVTEDNQRGVVYSRFPCPRDVLKIIRETGDGFSERKTNVILRREYSEVKLGLDFLNPLIVSDDWSFERNGRNKILSIGYVALQVEEELKRPVILEFSCFMENKLDSKVIIHPFQARSLTKVSQDQIFMMPQLQNKDLIASTQDLNGTGDYEGEAFVIRHPDDAGRISIDGLKEFDRSHPQGYVLVTPYLQFYNNDHLDDMTPNKKAVLAYMDLGLHHDMEISRKKGILYLNARESLHHSFFNARNKNTKDVPIRTKEQVRVVSDGIEGFVYNLSRNYLSKQNLA